MRPYLLCFNPKIKRGVMVEDTKDKTSKLISIANIYFILQIVGAVILSFWILFYHQPKTGDDVEHLHSAWLVWQGKVPYIDFFQHHNPLMWYLFAPLLGFFAYDIAVFDVVRIISTLLLLLNLYIVAKIIRRFASNSWSASLLGVASVFPSYIIYSGQDFRPDNYMLISFMGGVYYLLAYLDNKKQNKLNLSFFLFALSFFFMHKIVFSLLVIGGIIIYLLVKKHINISDFFKALIIPLSMVIVFLFWLIYHGMVLKYWLSNYIFNLYIPDVYGNLVEPTKPEFYVVSFIALIGSLYFLVKGNIYQRILSILWIAEALQRFFYFSLDRHYYYQLQVLNAIMAGAILWVIVKKYNILSLLCVGLSMWGCFIFYIYCKDNILPPNYHRYVTPKYVVEQTNRCDSVLNGYGITYGIFNKDVTYYWNLNGQLDVIGNKIGLAPLHDINKVIEEHLPHIIYTAPYWNEKLKKQNINVYVHLVSDEIKYKYYEQSLFMDVFILKKEYQNMRRCRFDAKTKTWNYYYTR